MTRTLKEITETLTELKTNNLEAIKQVEAELDKTNRAIAKAQQQQAEAQEADDMKVYEKASNSLWKANTTLEFLKNKLDKLNEPLLSQAEAMDIKAEIEDIFDSKNKEYFKKAYELVKALTDKAEQSSADINEANSLLEVLHYDIMKHPKTWTLGTDTDITKHKDVFGLYFNTISSTNFIQAVLKQGGNNND
ncbi:hypothetical protein MK549_08815 [Streptococcus gallolyticus subsp. gallolyticus]|uniref:hypothetical protein n=1 Tax=Streptococcus gallolyticus TaxID=315405 RepID=UPI0022846F15|nr:hypothetical protein [Streptococcus gallolyticus]MCY7202865.1 hypothetical protein [Streptococcus gallolyticus subsp. gallolyticus]